MCRSLLCLCIIICTAQTAAAQLFPPVKEKTLTMGMAAYKELDFNNSYLLSMSAGKEYRIRTWFSFGGEFYGYKFTKGQYSSIGVSVRPVTRVIVYDKHGLSIFAEGKGGPVFMIPQYPDRLINYTFAGGLGGDWQYNDHSALRATVAYNHFSNGKYSADLRNAVWDGIGLELSFVQILE